MPDIFDELFAVIVDRKVNPQPGSYTVKLLADADEALKKVGEEAVEVILAGKGQSDQRLVEESTGCHPPGAPTSPQIIPSVKGQAY